MGGPKPSAKEEQSPLLTALLILSVIGAGAVYVFVVLL